MTWNSNQQQYMGPCDTDMSGDLTFEIDGGEFSIPLTNYWLVHGMADGVMMCWLSFSLSPGPGMAVLGDPTLRNLYVVYDMEKMQIGIAPAVLDTDKSDIRSYTDLDRVTYVASQLATYAYMSVVPGLEYYVTSVDLAAAASFTDMYATDNFYAGTNDEVAEATSWSMEENMVIYSTADVSALEYLNSTAATTSRGSSTGSSTSKVSTTSAGAGGSRAGSSAWAVAGLAAALLLVLVAALA